jgi:hypothetical protein
MILLAGACLFGQFQLVAQNCPADLEWPTAPVAAPGTTTATVAWPASLQTNSIITDRHAKAATALKEVSLPALATGATVCDPVYGTSITRMTPNGYSIQLKDAFSPQGNWFLAIAEGGGISALAIDASTGKPRLDGTGKPVEVRLGYEMLPSSPNGGTCSVANVLFSRKDENIVYLMGCGARIFKYNLLAYNPLNPMAGLVAGSNRRSVASWPNCSTSYCRRGPVFMDFSDLFQGIASDGALSSMFLNLSDGDETFSGFMTAFNGYKNAQGVFAYRPWNDSLWYVSGSNVTQALMVQSIYEGAPVNKRLIGSQLDTSGRYLSMQICHDPTFSLDGCGTGRAYPIDLNVVSPGQPLLTAPVIGMVDLTHAGYGNAAAIGQSGVSLAMHINYFSPVFGKRNVELPDLITANKWWGTYTNLGAVPGPSGNPLAGVLTTFSFEAIGGSPAGLSNCPDRTCLYANEILLFNLSGTHFLRLGNTRMYSYDYPYTSYWDLPRPSISPDGKYILFSSNWGTPSTATQANYAVYMVRTPPSWKMLLDDQVTIKPSVKAVSPNEYLELRISHLRSSQGMVVLAQNSAQPQAAVPGACMFQVSQNKGIQLATDTGSLQQGPSGILGQTSSIANSACRIDVANSTMTPIDNHGNIEYRVRVLFTNNFANKNVRLIGRLASGSTWIDGGAVAIDSGASLRWIPIPGMPSITATPEKVYNSTNGYYQWGQVAGLLATGSSFEFKIGSGQDYNISLSTTLPASLYTARLQTTLAVFKNWLGQVEVQFTQDYGVRQIVSYAPLAPGSVVRLTYLPNQVQLFADGKLVGVANIQTNGQGLYILANLVLPGGEFLSPKVIVP